MADVTTTKNVGLVSALGVMSQRLVYDYPSNADGASANWEGVTDKLALHLTGSPSETAASAILTAIQKPTCTASLLAITVNCGTYLVNDVTNVTADNNDDLIFEVSLVINDSTGAIEAIVRERSDDDESEFAAFPTGKTFCCKLKEYTLVASGTALVESKDYIS